jgi:hypothetical protein
MNNNGVEGSVSLKTNSPEFLLGGGRGEANFGSLDNKNKILVQLIQKNYCEKNAPKWPD